MEFQGSYFDVAVERKKKAGGNDDDILKRVFFFWLDARYEIEISIIMVHRLGGNGFATSPTDKPDLTIARGFHK